MRIHVPVGACALAIGLLIPAVKADTIAFTGTGTQNGISKTFDISGDDFTFRVSTREGSPIVANCVPDTPCNINPVYSSGMNDLNGLLISSFASLGNISTTLVTGQLIFTGTAPIPSTIGSFSTTIPVSFTGDVVGHFNDPGRTVAFDVSMTGAGTAALGGEVLDARMAVVNRARYTFSGTANVSEIPEPGAVFLAGGGIGLLALLFRRRRRAMLS